MSECSEILFDVELLLSFCKLLALPVVDDVVVVCPKLCCSALHGSVTATFKMIYITGTMNIKKTRRNDEEKYPKKLR